MEQYSLDQTTTYLPQQRPVSITSNYDSSYRWTHPISKSLEHETNDYLDQTPHYSQGVPYIQTAIRPTTTEAMSSLNMGSLHLTLPERPRPRQHHVSNMTAPQKQLPIPQTIQDQTLRYRENLEQDGRLSLAKSLDSSTLHARGSFVKSAPSWSANGEDQIIHSGVIPTENVIMNAAKLPDAAKAELNNPSAKASATDDIVTVPNASQLPLKFNPSTLFEAMNTSVPSTTYSTFREYRDSGSPSLELMNRRSQLRPYMQSPDHGTRRKSLGSKSPEGCKRIADPRLVSTNQLQSQGISDVDNVRRESIKNQNLLPHRASMSNLSTVF